MISKYQTDGKPKRRKILFCARKKVPKRFSQGSLIVPDLVGTCHSGTDLMRLFLFLLQVSGSWSVSAKYMLEKITSFCKKNRISSIPGYPPNKRYFPES